MPDTGTRGDRKYTCSSELFLLPAALVARINARRVRGGCSRDRGKTRRHIRCPSSTCADEARPECMASISYPSRVCRPSPGNLILLTCDSIPDAIHVLVVAQRNRIESVVDAKDRNKPETAQKQMLPPSMDREVVLFRSFFVKVCRSIFQLMHFDCPNQGKQVAQA